MAVSSNMGQSLFVGRSVAGEKKKFSSPTLGSKAELTLLRIEVAISLCASAASQSSGTRWPLVTPRSSSWWRISASSAGPSFTASSTLDRMACCAPWS